MAKADLQEAARVLLQRNAAILYGYPMRGAMRDAKVRLLRRHGRSAKNKIRVQVALRLGEES